MLCARTSEVDGSDQLRNEFVSGFTIGGMLRTFAPFPRARARSDQIPTYLLLTLDPVIQRMMLCWDTKGENVTRLLRKSVQAILRDITSEQLPGYDPLSPKLSDPKSSDADSEKGSDRL